MRIDADAVVLGVPVEEDAELEQRVRGVLDAWDHTARREGGLLDVWKSRGVHVEEEPSKLLHR